MFYTYMLYNIDFNMYIIYYYYYYYYYIYFDVFHFIWNLDGFEFL
jgi:hypothetical protein